MHAPEAIPDRIVILVRHPWARHEDEEEYIHNNQHDEQSEYLD